MKKYLFPSLIAVGLLIFALVLVHITPPAHAVSAVDTSGRILLDGDLISASAYGDPDIYIINDVGFKRLFLNPAIFSFYGHLGGFARVKAVTPGVRDQFVTSGLFRNCETSAQAVYATEITGEDAGVLHHVELSGSTAASQDPNFFRKVFCINTREENFYAKSVTAYTALSQLPTYVRPTPTESCIPFPPCNEAYPYLCEYPNANYCSSTPTPRPAPSPSPTIAALPAGCYYQVIQCIVAPCDNPVVCPSGTYDGVTIRSVTVALKTLSPTIFDVTIRGTLLNGCFHLNDLNVLRNGNTFNIFTTTYATKNICTQIAQLFELHVPIDASNLPYYSPLFGRYQIVVNGVYQGFFTLPILAL